MYNETEQEYEGKLKWYNKARGFGFIATEFEGDVFVHATILQRFNGGKAPEDGKHVKVLAIRRGRKLRATKVLEVE